MARRAKPAADKPRKDKGSKVHDLEKRLAEALRQQTTTGEILKVISSSPTDVQPVFDTIVRSAVRLCSGIMAGVSLVRDGMLHHPANYGGPPEALAAIRERYPRPLDMSSTVGIAILTRSVYEAPDVEDPSVLEFTREAGRILGVRSFISVPMLREGEAIGAITVTRREPGRLSEVEVALLKTFADQAVIALENVRLFNETKEALEQQTATAEILRVISRSQTDVQPVFDAIIASAVRLLGGHTCGLTRVTGDQLELVALTSIDAAADALVRAAFPQSLQAVGAHPQAIRNRVPLNVADAHTDARLAEGERAFASIRGFRSWVVVPMLRDGVTIGSIGVTRREAGGFTADEIALLQMFADQAIIAIENVRLFTELQEKNGELTESLERQTATSEILRVISSSPTDVQPVFDAIAESAARLCESSDADIWRRADDRLLLVAHCGAIPVGPVAELGLPLVQGSVGGRSILTERPIQVGDVQAAAAEFPESSENARRVGFCTILSVPLMRKGVAIGAIILRRTEARLFTEQQVALLQTFADQAVIAIENVRLFTELQARTQELTRSVGELRALGEVGQAISSTLDLETVLTTIVSRAVQLSGLDGGAVFEYDDVAEEFVHRVATEAGGALAELRRATRIKKGEGVVGRTALTLAPAYVSDIAVPGAYDSRLRDNLIESGVRAILAVPMVRDEQLIGCLVVSRNRSGDFPTETIELLRTFATQSALAIQNARLFREIEVKSRQLEAASQHKSEFLANMSHELRTPLNAIIGFSEVLTDRMFGELNEKQEEYLKDIYASGTHLLSLINDILDLSKIEAGRMELELTDFDLPTALDNALMLVRERAQRRSLALHKDVDAGVGQIQGDERKIRQVVLNLLSNAIKFTPEGGRVELAAVPKDGCVEVSVSDTGIGIAPDDQEKVFEEFRQVGTADKKAEGTGLGLTLCRKFIELHGGKIWVKSQVGAGSTFTFTIPLRQGA